MSNLLPPKIVTFFQSVWTGTKDAINYIVSEGEKPYLISRTLRIDLKKFKPQGYWDFYKQVFDKRKPLGLLKNLPATINDVGKTIYENRTYLDFIYKDRKTVILFNPSFMRLEEKRTAFQLTAEKEKAILALKNSAKGLAKNLNKIGSKLALLDQNKSKLNPKTTERLSGYAQKYLSLIQGLKSVKELNVIPESSTSLSGIGEPLSTAVILIGVVIATGIIAYTLSSINEKNNLLNEYNKEAEILDKAINDEQQALVDYKAGKISSEQYDKKVQNAKDVIKSVQENQKEILDAQNPDGFLDKVKYLVITGIVGFGLITVLGKSKKGKG